MREIVAISPGYIQRLKARWPRDIVTLGLAALTAGLTVIFRWVERQQDLDACMPEFIGLLLLAGILYVIGVFWVERFRLGTTALLIILAGTILFRVTLLPAHATPSDDVYRYQWDGRVQRAHLNPYVVFPNSPGLEGLQNPDHPEPPAEESPTIYPPLTELVFRLIETVPGYKRASTILDLACVVVLMLLLGAMKQPLHRVLAYAWNPTVLISFAMSGHFDSLAIFTFLVALFFLVTNRPAFSMGALALSFLSKFFPVLLLVTFLKRVRLAHVGLFVALIFAFYIPYLNAGLHLLDGARNYARDWVNNGSLFHLLRYVAGSRVGGELIAALLLLAAIGYLAKKAGAAAVGESRSHGRSASAIADCLSLVFLLVDPVLVFLPKPRMVAHERHERPGLHSCNQLWRGGTTQELSSDVVARIRSRLRLAGLLLLGRAQGETISGSAGG